MYNYASMLAKVMLNGSRTITNYYGGGGATMVKKTDSQLGSRYYGPLTEHDSTGAVKKKFVYALGRCIAFVDSANGTHWMHQDAQGSTKLITNSSGTAENAYKYYPFGDSLNFTGTVKNDVKYTGQKYADGIEAYDFNARYYDPELGRFYSRDPMGSAAISPYAYCSNNPVNFTDPSGMCQAPMDDGGGGGCGGGDEWLITDKQTGQRTWTGTGDPYYGLPAGGLGLQGHIEWDEVTKSYIDPVTGELMTKTETYGYYVSDIFTDASGNSFDTHYTSGYMAHGRLDAIIDAIINKPIILAGDYRDGTPDELGLEAPPALLDPVNYLGAAAAGLTVGIWRYPNSGGAGVNLMKDGKRLLGIDYHNWGKTIKPFIKRIHIDIPGLTKHWPWG